MFYNIAGNASSPERDVRKLKYEYSLPELLKLKEWNDMTAAIETAANKDAELRSKQNK